MIKATEAIIMPEERKSTRGFSYAEVVMALAVLCIVLIPVFPALSLATRNLEIAQAHYRAQLYANELVTAAARGVTAPAMPDELIDLSYAYGCWITGGGTETVTVAVMTAADASGGGPGGGGPSGGVPGGGVSGGGVPTSEEAFYLSDDGTFTVALAVVWDDTGNPVGRALRVIP